MTITETAYQIETLKMLKKLDLNYEGHSWYNAEIVILQQALKKLLKD
jgi:hypothetical protein